MPRILLEIFYLLFIINNVIINNNIIINILFSVKQN